MYAKFHSSAFTGSMYGSGPVVFSTWAYALANADGKGFVELNSRAVAPCIGCSISDIEQAISFLCAPDPDSRSKAEDGKRLVREGQFLYRIVNHEQYRAARDPDDRREYMRNYMREYRKTGPEQPELESAYTVNVNSLQVHSKPRKPDLAQAEAKAEAEAVNPCVSVSIETETLVLAAEKSGDDPGAARVPAADFQSIVSSYHEILPSLSRVVSLTAARKAAIRQRWREVCVDSKLDAEGARQFFRDYWTRVSKSEFLMGKGQPAKGREAFVATFDWLIAPRNFIKVIEGNYDPKRRAA